MIFSVPFPRRGVHNITLQCAHARLPACLGFGDSCHGSPLVPGSLRRCRLLVPLRIDLARGRRPADFTRRARLLREIRPAGPGHALLRMPRPQEAARRPAPRFARRGAGRGRHRPGRRAREPGQEPAGQGRALQGQRGSGRGRPGRKSRPRSDPSPRARASRSRRKTANSGPSVRSPTRPCPRCGTGPGRVIRSTISYWPGWRRRSSAPWSPRTGARSSAAPPST
jgi:hypothetical protein